ncbi:hypothetical protein GGX14DRAFT_558831 [Mycena pura]|uniref:NACHT domain-containing protein n=1 Tax=Mycena pura TaxID=153505 RepID=A0AAD6YJ67_9AGAR|nr:hypothetical protein GGX14DRAFT_558831 [Mycena pura]
MSFHLNTALTLASTGTQIPYDVLEHLIDYESYCSAKKHVYVVDFYLKYPNMNEICASRARAPHTVHAAPTRVLQNGPTVSHAELRVISGLMAPVWLPRRMLAARRTVHTDAARPAARGADADAGPDMDSTVSSFALDTRPGQLGRHDEMGVLGEAAAEVRCIHVRLTPCHLPAQKGCRAGAGFPASPGGVFRRMDYCQKKATKSVVKHLRQAPSMDQLEPGSLSPPKNPVIDDTDRKLKVKLKIMKAHGLPKRKVGSAYIVSVTAGEGVEEKTRPANGINPHWNQEIDIVECSFEHSDMKLEVVISAITNASDTVTKDPTDLAQVATAFHKATDPILGKKSPMQLSAALERREELSAVGDAATGLVQAFEPLSEIFGNFLKNLEIFCGVVDAITEIHPYAKLAWNLIKWIPNSLLSEIDLQDSITDLCKALDGTLSFIENAEPIKKRQDPDLKNQQTILSRLTLQVLECCRFLNEFTRKIDGDNLVLRTVKHSFSREDATKKIAAYLTTLQSLQREFEGRASVITQVAVFRFLATVDTVVDDLRELQESQIPILLRREEDATFRADKGCLPGTRVKILEHLTQWIETPNPDTCAFILFGIAGSGKSAIAHEIARQYSVMHCLGCSFYFSSSDSTSRRPHTLFKNMALDLADFDTALRSVIAESLKADSSLAASRECGKLFKHLIQEPVEKLSAVGPILVVIDALDESGSDAAERKELLDVLSQNLSALPSNFRFLITSRPYQDILDSFSSSTKFLNMHMTDEIPQSDILRDITTFISTEFKRQFKNDAKYYSQYIDGLADKAEGLFQWASLACQLSTQCMFSSPEEVIKDILSLPSNSLDALYTKALKSFVQPGGDFSCFRRIMSFVLSAFEPLTMQTLSKMYRLAMESSVGDIPDREDPIKRVLGLMGALLSGVHIDNVQIRPLHTSFRDFLLDSKRSGDFHVNCDQGHRDFAISTLRYMNNPGKLFFNMCGLETSYRRNRDIPDFRARVDRALDRDVSYSSRFWAKHLEKVPTDALFSEPLKRWINEKLLFWLEALSLLDAYAAGPASLSIALKWSKDNLPSDKSSISMLEDALHFCRVFARCIVQSAPHLYLSALPLCPDNSLIKQRYLPLFHSTLRLSSGAMVAWPQQQMSIAFAHRPVAVAMSSDGARIAVGLLKHSGDTEVRFWDAETGDQARTVLEHLGSVRSIALSADGKRVVSGSWDDCRVRIWNADTGKQIGAALAGHSGYISSVAISADGKRVVSGSNDSTVRIWNVDTGVGTALEGHSDEVTSVALSTDGKRAVSGSGDRTVCIWNADTGEQIGAALKGHSRVRSVAISADGKHVVVSGSIDGTMRIWNLDTDKEVGVAHSNAVTSVALSADGMRAVSVSGGTMRIWNAHTGQQIGTALEHGTPILSVALSADGKRAVSGAWDVTDKVRIWNTEISEQVVAPPQLRSGKFMSAALSADGKRVVCGFDDHTLRIWNVDTGDQVGTALEEHSGPVTSVAFSANGRCVVSGSYGDTAMRIWNADSGEEVAVLEGNSSGVKSVALSLDGHRIISVSWDCAVRIWNAEKYEQAGPAFYGMPETTCVALSADAKRAVSASQTGAVCIWNTDSGEEIGSALKGQPHRVSHVALSADGTRVVSVSPLDIYLYNVTTGERIDTLAAFSYEHIHNTAVALSADGKYFLSADFRGTIHIWDTDTGKQVVSALQGHSNLPNVNSVAFSADSKRIVSLSDDQVRVWNVDRGKQAEERGVLGFCSDRQSHGLRRVDLLTGVVPVTYPPGSDLRDMVRLDDDGWIVYNNGIEEHLIVWIPLAQRPQLYGPRTQLIIGDKTELDMSNFVHGSQWADCYRPQSS